MNYRMIFSTVGKVLIIEAVLFVAPLIISLLYAEFYSVLWFGVCLLIALAAGVALVYFCKPKSMTIFTKEGLVTVALTWIFMSAIGALPFVMTGVLPSYLDAFFETVSGFTTTGSSVITDIDSVYASCKGLLFWRSFTHWIGGMGVLVFVMAVTGKNPDRSIYILKAEMPGPTMDKIVPRSRDTAKILYLIYLVMTVVCFILLLCGGMSPYDSIVHTFGVAGTGGFGIRSDGCASYSPFCQWVMIVFLFLFGVNFNLYYLILIGKIKNVFASSELRLYSGIVFAAIALITWNIFSSCANFGEALRLSAFQVMSIVSTAGFSTADYTKWPALSQAVLVFLMFTGACAGSTAGGFKMSRVLLISKATGRELKQVLHPRTTSVVKIDGKKVDEGVIRGAGTYLMAYVICLLVFFLIVSFDSFDFETNMSAVISCFNNVGPGLGKVGPAGSYAGYSVVSKIALTFAMLLGRLEIYPMLIVLLPSTWIRK